MAYLERLEESAREGSTSAQNDLASAQSMPPPPARSAKPKPPAGIDKCYFYHFPEQAVTNDAESQVKKAFNSRLSSQQQRRVVALQAH